MTATDERPSRRMFMKYACCAAAAAAAPRCVAAESDGVIDVHHHVCPPAWLEGARDQIAATNRNTSVVTGWSVQKSLDDMDQNGVATSMVSITNPGIWFGDAAKARKLARVCNEYMADLKRDRPGRFGGLASLPLPDTDGSLEEIRYTLDTLKLDGFGFMTNYDDRWLGDAAFTPVLEELARRKATVYVHPNASACCGAAIPDVSPSVIEFPLDTTRTIVSLLFSGALAKYPDINWIFSHAGGALPMLAERMTNIIQSQPRLQSRIPNGAMHELRKLHYDLAQGTSPMQLAALTKMVDARQIVFGTDFPFWSAKSVRAGMAAGDFDAAAQDAIWRGNARRLFPTLV
ncbi:MAG: amidohydrolase [Hyphomicrobiales bacterium]|nr:amidohydrolase [Hyphomicrobiales bacterium]